VNLTEIQNDLVGDWTGNNLLRLSWVNPPDSLSPSDLKVATVARGKFLTFTYTWNHEGVPQEGLILLGHDQGDSAATAAWVDSWHMSAKVMSCRGAIDEQGEVNLRGSYEAPPGPDWGWRIVITPDAARELRLVMFNCSPEGAEELAVRADYRRVV
jgi:Protein of unknown function (DUF1579)